MVSRTMFARGIESLGLINLLTNHLKDAPAAVTVASIVIPWIMATDSFYGSIPPLLPRSQWRSIRFTHRSGSLVHR